MGAVWLVFGAELRRRWRSWLILAVLIAIVGGLVLAASAAGRRTATAFPRFVAAHGYDVSVFNFTPLPGLAHEVDVASVTRAAIAFNGNLACACGRGINDASVSFLGLLAFRARPCHETGGRPDARPVLARPGAGIGQPGTGLWGPRRDGGPHTVLHRGTGAAVRRRREHQPGGPDDDLPRGGDRDRRERVPRW